MITPERLIELRDFSNEMLEFSGPLFQDEREELVTRLLAAETQLAELRGQAQEPFAYVFKNPNGPLFYAITDKSNAGAKDVIPVWDCPVPPAASQTYTVPDAIEPTYEAIKSVLPTANPDEYACCVGADMWNACRAAFLQSVKDK